MDGTAEAHAAFFGLTGVGVVQIDRQTGRFVRVNGAFCDMVGYSEAELWALTFQELAHPDEREHGAVALGAVKRGEGDGDTLPTRYVHKDGRTVWLELHLTSFHDGAGGYHLAVVSDVTGHRRAEEKLRQSEARYRTLFTSVGEAFALCELILDDAGVPADVRILEVNPAHEAMTGLSAAETVGKTTRELIPDITAWWLECYGHAVRRGESVRFEHYAASLDRRFSIYGFKVGEDEGTFALLYTDVTERQQAEEKLRASEEKYRTLFGSIDEGFCTFEILFDDVGRPVDYRFLEMNPAFERMTGLEQAAGKTALELVPALEPWWIHTYGEVALTGRAVRFESRSDAMNRWFDVYASRVGGETSRKVALVFSDITTRKRMEAALRESEERLRLTLESVTDYAIFTMDTENRIASWNVGAERTFGYSEEEVLGQLGDLIFTPEDREQGVPTEELRVARETGRAADERWHLRRDGAHFFVSGVLTPLWGGERLTGYVKVARDLTEQRRLEEEREQLLGELKGLNDTLERRVEERTEALKQSEVRFSQAFHVAPVATCLTTLGRETFLEVNDAFVQLTGYTKAEVIDKDVFTLGMWASKEDQEKVDAARRGGGSFRNLELKVRTKGGEVLDILLSGEVVDLGGEQGNLRMFYDISERKQTEEQLHRALREVMSDTSWFSHKVLERLAQLKLGTTEPTAGVDLSHREQQVLELLAGGQSNETIARALGLSPQTVRNYVSTIYSKLGVHSRVEAVVWARERGIVG